MPFSRIKAKCVTCGLHFIVCTEHREGHSRDTLYCPECGQHSGDFVTWSDGDSGDIFQDVPGQSPLTPDMNVIYSGEVPIEDIE